MKRPREPTPFDTIADLAPGPAGFWRAGLAVWAAAALMGALAPDALVRLDVSVRLMLFLPPVALIALWAGSSAGAVAALFGAALAARFSWDTTVAQPGVYAVYAATAVVLVFACGAARQAVKLLRDRERALKRSETQLRTLTDSLPELIWSALPSGSHDYFNGRWYRYTDAPPGVVGSEGLHARLHRDEAERVWGAWRAAVVAGEPFETECRLRGADGRYRWFLLRALPVRDETGKILRWFGAFTDTKSTSDQLALVSQELSHRIKNIFAVLSGLMTLSARGRPEAQGFIDDLRRRVGALARAHEYIRPHSPQSAPAASTLFEAIQDLLSPYGSGDGRRFRFAGEDAGVLATTMTPLALLFHELATNAAKYGALSSPEGWVAVVGEREAETYTLHWRERGGPPVAGPPEKTGFGVKLAALSVEAQLEGTLEWRWEEEGVEMTATIPARHAPPPVEDDAPRRRAIG